MSAPPEMNPATLERLEFSPLKELLRARLTSAPGQRALERLAPSSDRTWIEREQERVAEARAFLDPGEELGFGGLVDPAPLVAKLAVSEVVLAPQELLDLATLLDAATSTRRTLGAPRFRSLLPRLRELAAELPDFSALERNLRRRILPGGEVDTYASPALAEIRATIEQTERKLHRTLKRVREKAAAEAALQDEYVTLRGGRLVLPIRSDARTRPEGVIHAASGTGQTLFLEPLETIALNNELVRLREEEAAEIRRLLRTLTELLARRRPELEHTAEIIGALDTIFARARYARDFRCTRPTLNPDHSLTLTAVRHPLLEAARLRAAGHGGQARAPEAGQSVVPISVTLSSEQHVLVISGPNAGGKTAALKTLGLAALAAQAGIPVPAEDARLPVFEHVLADIGDEQSLVENLSTFSAHILNLREMAGQASARSLVLLDELGAATSPEEGAALGIALLEHFRQCGALTVATTHHERLKAYAASTPGAMNAAVEFDEVRLRPTYRLRMGVPGVSSGLEMAARLGLGTEIVQAARKHLTAEAAENAGFIRSLHQTQQALERLQGEVRTELARLREERQQLQREWLKEQRRKLAELERNLDTQLGSYRKELRAVVDALPASPQQRERLEKAGVRQLSKVQAEAKQEFDTTVLSHLGESAPTVERPRVKPEQLIPGARVKLRGIARPGVVLSQLGAEQVEVQLGSLRMRARADDIEAIVRSAEKPLPKITLKTRRTAETQRAQRSAVPELHVRGLRVEETLAKVDKFLDESVLAGQTEVRLIHGIGKGALKKALTEFLAGHPHVESAQEAAREHGGVGVTVVRLKRQGG
ncbi:MAG: endonuclease MutS2 [Terriglobia bacterium]